jgi:hypothetical protein
MRYATNNCGRALCHSSKCSLTVLCWMLAWREGTDPVAGRHQRGRPTGGGGEEEAACCPKGKGRAAHGPRQRSREYSRSSPHLRTRLLPSRSLVKQETLWMQPHDSAWCDKQALI